MSFRQSSICAVCDASLERMGLNQPCPACGFRPNDDRQTIHQSSVSATALLVVGIMLFLAGASGRAFGNWEAHYLFVLSLCVVMTWRVITGRRRKAVLWSEGFVLLGRTEHAERFSWSDVRRVCVSPAGNAIDLVSESGNLIDAIEIDFFGSPHRAEQFCAAAAEWARRQTPAPMQ